jgi:four helix bundle protein
MMKHSSAADHRGLRVWQEAIALAVDVVTVTGSFPPSERYGLASQMRRAAFSVPSNIAEGAGQGTRRGYAHFVSIARGSLAELHTGLEIARRCQWIPADPHRDLEVRLDRLARMLTALRKTLGAKVQSSPAQDP